MAVALHVYIRDEHDPLKIPVEHVFYGATEAEADQIRLAHLAGCENYAKAEVDDRVAELTESIDDSELPDAEEIFDGEDEEGIDEGDDLADDEGDEDESEVEK